MVLSMGENKFHRVVLAYSGGLDTSVAIRWIMKELGAEVITVTVDVGQEDDFNNIEYRAYKIGAVKHYTIDAKEEFAKDYALKSLLFNALYEGKYPIGTALARPLIALKVVEIAKKEGADAIAHGCTSKGNDQVRFDLTISALSPNLKIIAPARMWGMKRADVLEFAKKENIPIPTPHHKFSIDSNLWSRSIEGSEIDDPSKEVPEEVFQWTVNPVKAPNQPTYVKIKFKEGIPTAINDEKLPPVKLILTLNTLAGSHGVGRIDHIENRVVGLKSREVYEAPAATVLIEAHKDLEKLVLTPKELRFKYLVDTTWTDLVYGGLWWEPLRYELDVLAKEMNKWITGEVKVKLYKGSALVVSRESPYSGLSTELIDYEKGWYPSNDEAQGFIKLWGLHSLHALRVRKIV